MEEMERKKKMKIKKKNIKEKTTSQDILLSKGIIGQNFKFITFNRITIFHGNSNTHYIT